LLYRLISLFDYKRHYHRQSSGLKTVPMRILESVVAEGEIQTLDLGKRVDIPPATLIGVLDDLETRGLARRIRSKADKRVVLISPTPEGALVVSRRRREEELFRKNIGAGLDSGEREKLSELLARLFDGIGDYSNLFKE
jgi:DNA-binding MarR family transcriptional regulator